MVIDKVIQVSDLKKNPGRILEEVRRGTPVTITQGRNADTIIVPRDAWGRLLARVEELEAELETLEILADPKVKERLAEGLPKHGIPLEEAREALRGGR